jgi:hypothetical protein
MKTHLRKLKIELLEYLPSGIGYSSNRWVHPCIQKIVAVSKLRLVD